jgi:selenide,water dikinase
MEVARASRVAVTIRTGCLPVLPGVREYARAGFVPAGTQANRRYFQPCCRWEGAPDPDTEDIVFDPQTSGGLLVFLPGDEAEKCLSALHRRGVAEAAIIGDVTGVSGCGEVLFS